MFGVDSTELIIVAIAALLFIGPKDLPRVMRTVGHWVGKVRGMARHFQAGMETMMREAELEEMERKWRDENERIMRDFPGTAVGEGDASAQVMLPFAPPDDELPPAELPPTERPLP